MLLSMLRETIPCFSITIYDSFTSTQFQILSIQISSFHLFRYLLKILTIYLFTRIEQRNGSFNGKYKNVESIQTLRILRRNDFLRLVNENLLLFVLLFLNARDKRNCKEDGKRYSTNSSILGNVRTYSGLFGVERKLPMSNDASDSNVCDHLFPCLAVDVVRLKMCDTV